MVGLGRIELPTSRLSGVRSNRTELQARYGGRDAKAAALPENRGQVSEVGMNSEPPHYLALCKVNQKTDIGSLISVL